MNEAVRVLVVDDEEIVRESLSGWLRKDGHDTLAAPDGRAALEALRAEPWDVVLLDLKMPGMDGLQVLEEARRERAGSVFVVMTAYATVDTAVSAMKLGAYDYLVKPFDPEELSAIVRRIATQRALVRENESLRRALKLEYGFHALASKSAPMERVHGAPASRRPTPPGRGGSSWSDASHVPRPDASARETQRLRRRLAFALVPDARVRGKGRHASACACERGASRHRHGGGGRHPPRGGHLRG